ncbi:VCBS domain-containing protein, partial [Achromobacter animicus]|uniref:VCBS domain-containing protein n=1 Tax=Achromobacter animicus TaxID=1389935 RepID=UPI0015818F02
GWDFKVNDGLLDSLGAGQTLTQTYTVTIADGKGGTATQDITITITGTNDAPTITSGAQAGVITEVADGATGENTTEHTAGGTIQFADVDTVDTHTATVTANGDNYLGTLTLGAVNAADKSLGWDFKVNDGVLDALGAGQTLTQTYTVTITDGKGGTATQDITITITGTNDAPILNPEVTLGNQASNDSDVVVDLNIATQFMDVDGGDKLTFSANGLPPGLTLDPATGLITGKIESSASQGGNNGVYTVLITATDLSGASVSQSFEWNVKNPAPTAADDAGKTDEDHALTVTAQDGVLSNDSDIDGDALHVSAVNGHAASVGKAIAGSNGGSFTLNADGSYTFNPGPDFQALNDGETKETSITYTVTDKDGASSTATLIVTVTGQTDGPPVVTPVDTDGNVTSAHNSVVEGSGETVNGSVGVSAEAGITAVTVAGRDVTGA